MRAKIMRMDPAKQQPQTVQPQAQHPVQPPLAVHQPPVTEQPAQPVSVPVGAGKEGTPAGETQQAPVIQPSEAVPVLHPEVEKAGVEVTPQHEVPQVPQEVQYVLQQPQQAPQPVAQESISPAAAMPLTAVQAETVAKKKKWRESVTWLAMFVLRQLKIVEHPKEGK